MKPQRVNFSLKKTKSRADGKCPVYVRCTMSNQRFECSTWIFIHPDLWNANKLDSKILPGNYALRMAGLANTQSDRNNR